MRTKYNYDKINIISLETYERIGIHIWENAISKLNYSVTNQLSLAKKVEILHAVFNKNIINSKKRSTYQNKNFQTFLKQKQWTILDFTN